MPDEATLVKAFYIYKIYLDRHARAAGGTLQFLNQHTILWNIQKQASHSIQHQNSDGVCAGLAIEWLKTTCGGGDFLADLGNVRNDVLSQPGKGKGAASLKGGSNILLTGVDKSHLQQRNVARALEGVGKPLQGSPWKSPYAFKNAKSRFSPGNFYYISSGTHATAAVCRGKTVDFYDPNVGLVKGAALSVVGDYFADAVFQTYAHILGSRDAKGDASKKELLISGFKPLKAIP